MDDDDSINRESHLDIYQQDVKKQPKGCIFIFNGFAYLLALVLLRVR